MSLPIYYTKSRGIPGAYVTPFRITANDDGTYVMHATKFVIDSKEYELKKDVQFSVPDGPFVGSMYADAKTGGVGLIVLDPALLRAGTGGGKESLAEYGYGITRVFVRASYHDGKQEDCMVVMTAEDPSTFDEKGVWSGPGELKRSAAAPSPAAYEQDFPPFVEARKKLDSQKEYRAKMDAISQKPWGDLSPEERDLVNQKLAEKLGLVMPTVGDTGKPATRPIGPKK